MARSLCPASCRFFILLVSLGGLTTGFTGCGGVSGDPPPVSPPNHPKDACAVATVQGNVSQQFLIGSDALGSLFAYKLDQETGVLTAMPWSPMQLDGSLGSETTDATGDYLYVAMQITPTYHALETFRFPRDGSAPVRLDSRLAPEGVIAFDPQHRYLYVLNEANITNSPDPADNASLSVFRIDSSHLPHDTDQTVMLPERADAFGFKDQGRAVVVSRQRRTYGNTSIAVLKRDCKTGGLTPASETPIPRSQWLSVPLVGNGMIAYRLCCDPNAPSGSQLSSYDPSSHSVAAVSNGTLLDTYTAAIDHASDFAVMVSVENPNQLSGPADLVKVYRYDPNAVTLTQTDQYRFPPHADGNPESPFGTVFDLNDEFVYIPIENAVAVFRLDHSTGKITPILGSPFPVATFLSHIFVFGQYRVTPSR